MEVQKEMKKTKSFQNQNTQLHLFHDENNLWRCGGKIENVDVPYQVKYPYILDKKRYFTKLIIAFRHKPINYNGVRETLNSTLAEDLFLQGRSITCKFLFDCSICKKNKGKPYSYPQYSNLPKERISEGHAFLNVGIEYAGPLCVKNIYNKDSNDMYKVWPVIIRCALLKLNLYLIPVLR